MSPSPPRPLPLAALLVAAAVGSALGAAPAAANPGSPDRRAEEPEDPGWLAGLGDSLPKLVIGLVNDNIPGTIEPGRTEYRAPATVVLHDVKVKGPDGLLVASVGRLEATVSVSAALDGNVVVTNLLIDRPQLFLKMKDGHLNLELAFVHPGGKKDAKKKDKPSEMEIRLEKVRVTQASLDYKDPGKLDLTASGIDGNGRVEVYVGPGKVFVSGEQTRIQSGQLRLVREQGPLVVPFRQVTLEAFRLRDKRLAVERLVATAVGARVEGGGKVNLDGAGALDLAVHVDAPPGTWLDGLDPLPFATPRVRADVALSGPFDRPIIGASGRFEPFEAYDLHLGKGTFDVRVEPDKVIIKKSLVALGSGSAGATGSFVLESQLLHLDLDLNQVPMKEAARPAKLDPAPKGAVSGQVSVDGKADGKATLSVGGTLKLLSVQAFDLTPPKVVTANVALKVKPDRIEVTTGRLKGTGLDAAATGTVFLEQKRVSLDVVAEVADPSTLTAKIPPDISAGDVRFEGTVKGPYAKVKVTGLAQVARLDAYGVPGVDVVTRLVVTPDELRADDLQGNIAGGDATGHVVVGLGREGKIEGRVLVRGAALHLIQPPGAEDVDADGVLDLDADLSGPAEAPLIHAVVLGRDVVVQGEALGEVRADAWITTTDVRVSRLRVAGPSLMAHNRGEVVVNLERKEMAGWVFVDRFVPGGLRAAEDAGLAGELSGPIELAGTFDHPRIGGPLSLNDLEVSGIPLGSGIARVDYVPDAAPGRTAEHLVLLSCQLAGPRGDLQVRAGYAVERKVVQAELELAGTDLEPWLALASDEPLPYEGTADLSARATGPLDDLEIKATLTLPEVAVRLAKPPPPLPGAIHRISNELRGYATRGAVRLDATLRQGQLEALLCAFPTSTPSDNLSPCPGTERVWAEVRGPFDPDTGALELQVVARVEDPALEQLVGSLGEADLALAAAALADVRLRRAAGEDAPLLYDGQVTVESLAVRPVGAPTVVLKEPRSIPVSNELIELAPPLVFQSGGTDLLVGGTVSPAKEQLHINVKGDVALSLLKPLTPELQAAGGAARGDLLVSGRFSQPVVNGCVTPGEGAFVTPRSLGRRIDLRGGEICSGLSDDGDVLRARAKAFEVGLDDGRATLEGEADIHLAKQKIVRWDLHAYGSSLFFRLRHGFTEVAFDVALTETTGLTDEEISLLAEGAEIPPLHPLLAGRVEVNDGSVKETFELKNFVVTQSASETKGEPLGATLDSIGLAGLEYDLDITVHNFQARANLATFRADASARGDITVKGSALAPLVGGAVEVVDGIIQFPYAAFEVEQSQIEFPTSEDGTIKPRLFLLARSELEPPRNGLDVEVPVLLVLEGNLDRMDLNLEAEATEFNFNEGQLMRYILLGTQLSSSQQIQDPDAALRAVSSELTAAFSRDLEEAIAEQFGAQLQFNVFYEDGQVKGGVRYQLGERLKFDGEAGIYAIGATTGGGGGATGSVTEARIRLLLLDHLPVGLGKDLAFEGHVTTADRVTQQPSTDLRLGYRFFEF